ncbi:class F sortase [Ornithinimicrobium sp. W1679]|uniref:class F sortase n=1 Tax=Ornithinimicrobium sp. W1679 TaxID=3418770 RepID=UPI003CE9AC0E
MPQPHRERRGDRRPALPGALAGVVTALGIGLVACGVSGQVPDPPAPSSAVTQTSAPRAGAAGPSSETGPAPTPDPAPTPTPGSSPTPDPSTPQGTAVATSPAPSSAPVATAYPAVDPSPPVEVRLPALGVTSPLHPLGLAADGTLEVPTGDRVDEAAWYSGSPTPGEVGPTVVEGHVTGPGGRPSVFFELGASAVGDLVELDREDGRTVVYEVYRVDRFAKDAFPTVDVYGTTPGPELRVITCGGEFDEASGHHVDNTVVFARQVSISG